MPTCNTWIERLFAEWAKEECIDVQPQFRIDGEGHCYDFYIFGTKILVELDGVYWHTRPGARQKDEYYEERAKKCGYRVIRFTDTELKLKMKDAFVCLKEMI